MLALKTITSIAEALATKYSSNHEAVKIFDNCLSVGDPLKLELSISNFGFKVTLRLYEDNPKYDPTRSSNPFSQTYRPNRCNLKYIVTPFVKVNPLGPFSKIFIIIKTLKRKEASRIRDNKMTQLMEKINKAVDLSAAQFEKDILGGK